MLPSIGGGELLLIGILALIVIGPKELPGVLRTLGKTFGAIKRMANQFRSEFSNAIRESDLDNVRQDLVKEVKAMDPSSELKEDFEKLSDELDMDDKPEKQKGDKADKKSKPASKEKPATDAAPVKVAKAKAAPGKKTAKASGKKTVATKEAAAKTKPKTAPKAASKAPPKSKPKAPPKTQTKAPPKTKPKAASKTKPKATT